MTDLNAEITTTSKRLLEVAKGVRGVAIKDLVQEAIDSWLKSHGFTPDLLTRFDAPDAKPRKR